MTRPLGEYALMTRELRALATDPDPIRPVALPASSMGTAPRSLTVEAAEAIYAQIRPDAPQVIAARVARLEHAVATWEADRRAARKDAAA